MTKTAENPNRIRGMCVLLFGIVVVAFSRALFCDFQFFDEADYLINNPHVNSGLTWPNIVWAFGNADKANWYPLTWISHMMDFEIYDQEPFGHHLTNILIHAANGVLLFLVLKRMTGALWRSFVVATLFALHPLRVESVAWISERKDVLSAFFGLLALWTYARYVEEAKNQNGRVKYFYGLTLLFFACSLMSKAMLVTFPFVLLLLDFWPLQRLNASSIRRLILEKIPFLLLVLPVSMMAFIAQKNGRELVLNLSWSFRIETAVINYPRYILKMFWPSDLSVLYTWPNSWPFIELLIAAVFVIGISITVFVLRRSHPYLPTGWFWYLGTLVPVIGLIPLGTQSMANHYSYFPMIGVLLALIWLISDFFKQWPRHVIAPATVALLTIALCIWRVSAELIYWKDSATLWSRAIAVTQNNWGAHYCLGQILWDTDTDASLSEFQKSVDIYPDFADSQRALGGALAQSGRFAEAVEHYKKTISLEPQNSWAYNGAGSSLLKLDQVGDAIPFLLEAAEVDEGSAAHKQNLDYALFHSGHDVEAMKSFLQAAESDRKSFDGFLNSLETDTTRVDLMNNLAWAFATYPEAKFRNSDYAVRLATRASEITGYKMTVCVGTLAAAYAESGRFDDAISTAEKAVALAKQNGESDLLQKDQDLLERFRAHQPYHEAN